MKQRDLVKLLEKVGWVISSGSNHNMAKHPEHIGVKIPIPRHKEISEYTATQILKEAGLK